MIQMIMNHIIVLTVRCYLYMRENHQLSYCASLNCFLPNNILFTWNPEKDFIRNNYTQI